MTIEVKTKKWGNSLGIIIPAEAVEKLNLKPEQKLRIDINISTENPLKEMFGAFKDKKIKITQEEIKDLRKEMEGKWLKDD
jgi:antitoxin component of MazEF toxin-antitoxin module